MKAEEAGKPNEIRGFGGIEAATEAFRPCHAVTREIGISGPLKGVITDTLNPVSECR